MADFKNGDKVVCVCGLDFGDTNSIVEGEIYVIHHVANQDVVLEGNNISFLKTRFKIYDEVALEEKVRDCTCSKDQIWAGGCICGFVKKYEPEW